MISVRALQHLIEFGVHQERKLVEFVARVLSLDASLTWRMVWWKRSSSPDEWLLTSSDCRQEVNPLTLAMGLYKVFHFS